MNTLAKAGAVVMAVAAVGYLTNPDAGSAAGGAGCVVVGAASGAVAGWGAEQVAHAATIVAVGKRLSVPERGRVVAVATAMQESRLRNLDYGDRDSLGLFQQRPSQGWGSPAQVMNPSYAATQFYRRLVAVRGWRVMSVSEAAQAVQRSAYPDAYRQHETDARAVAAAVSGARCT